MSANFSRFRVGQPLCHQALSVVPLFAEPNGQVDYLLSDQAMTAEAVVVEEVNEQGSVPELLVRNRGDRRVLFLEGEALVGAKQNRVLNTSVLVSAASTLKVPVSCVEKGRWGYTSSKLHSGGSHSPSKLRRALKTSVSAAAMAGRGYRSDQRAVWREVAELHAIHNAASPTQAMDDAFTGYEQRITEFRQRLKYVQGASGVVLAVGREIVALDVFDKPATLQHVWDRLLAGYVLDALAAVGSGGNVDTADVEQLLTSAEEFDWQPTESIGEGEQLRAQSGEGYFASVLSFGGTLVHGSVVPAS